MLKSLVLILSFLVLFAAIWIIAPAPDYRVWLLAVAASEWSLWLALIALLALIFAAFSNNSSFVFRTTTAIAALAALSISLYPLFSVLKLANEENVSLSLAEYFSGLSGEKLLNANFATHTFAEVDGKALQLDVYAPETVNENNGAAIIVVHGGSWRSGARNDFPQWNKWLAAQGFTVFDVDYRLAPQPNYLSSTADVKCAVLWVKERAVEFNISPARIAVLGRSAGGHLALLAAYTAGDARFPAGCKANLGDEKVRAVASFYAPIDLFWGFNNPANQAVIDGRETLAAFLGGNPHESDEIRAKYTLASPTTHVSAQNPPTFLVHGGKDQLVRDENMLFLDAALKESNIAHKTLFIPYAQHGFDYNFHGFGAQIVKPLLLDFLRENTK